MLKFTRLDDEKFAGVVAILKSAKKVHGSNAGITHNIFIIFVVLSDHRGSSMKQATISSSKLFWNDRMFCVHRIIQV